MTNTMKRGSKEWHRAWAALSAKIGEDATRRPTDDELESWQYMGTDAHGTHEFRHRCFRGERKLVHIEASLVGQTVMLPDGETGRVEAENGTELVISQNHKTFGCGPWYFQRAQVMPL